MRRMLFPPPCWCPPSTAPPSPWSSHTPLPLQPPAAHNCSSISFHSLICPTMLVFLPIIFPPLICTCSNLLSITFSSSSILYTVLNLVSVQTKEWWDILSLSFIISSLNSSTTANLSLVSPSILSIQSLTVAWFMSPFYFTWLNIFCLASTLPFKAVIMALATFISIPVIAIPSCLATPSPPSSPAP